MTYTRTIILNFVGFNILVVVLYSALLSESLTTVEDLLVQSFVEQESRFFADSYATLGERAPLPFSRQFKGYHADSKDIPDWLVGLPPGFHKHEDQLHGSVVALSDGGLFYLLYDESQGFLDANEMQINLLIVLISAVVVGIGVLVSLVQVNMITAPIRQLTQQVSGTDDALPKIQPLPRKDELGQLSRAYSQLVDRLSGFIQREQEFTRHASHELRTPLTVISNNLELLQQADADPPMVTRSIGRMETAVQRMKRNIAVLLLLGREQELSPTETPIDITRCIADVTDDYPQVALRIDRQSQPSLHVDPVVFISVMDNLLRNVREHGERSGDVCPADLIITDRRLSLTNRINPAHRLSRSRGFGLAISEKLCGAAGWLFSHKAAGDVFQAEIRFPQLHEPTLVNPSERQ